MKKDLYKFKDKMDPDLNGGAPILGVNGLVIKTHGSSNAKTVKHVIIKACELANSSFLEDIRLILMFDKVKEIVVEQLGVDEDSVTMNASFIDDLGADSLDIVELIMAFEDNFNVEIPDADAEKISTVGDVVEYINNMKK